MYTHMHCHTHIHIHIQACLHVHTHALSHTHTHPYTHVYTVRHTYTHTHISICTCTHICAVTHTYTHKHMYKYTHMCSHTHTDRHKHAHLSFRPVCSTVNSGRRIDWSQFVSVRFHSDSGIKYQTEEIVDHLHMRSTMNSSLQCSKQSAKSLTSKRNTLLGTSRAVRSASCLNWALWWSRRKVSTGVTPSGCINSSNSLMCVT